MDELVGVFRGEKFRKNDWWIGTVAVDGGGSMTVTGESERGDLSVGARVRFYGKIAEHPRFGKQFNFQSFSGEMPADRDAISLYLSRLCDGIGQAIGNRLFDAFGDQTLEIMRTDPGRAASVIGGASAREIADQAKIVLSREAEFESVRVGLMSLFAGRGFPRRTVDAVLKKWKGRALDFLEREPFLLLTDGFAGIGFTRADKLYMDLGRDPGALRRQMLAAWHAIESDGAGHTWFAFEEIAKEIAKKVKAKVRARDAVDFGVRKDWLATRIDDAGREWVTTKTRADAETNVAASIARLQETPNRWPTDIETSQEDGDGMVSQHQADALFGATLGPVGILEGPPGTGKTFALAALIRRVLAGPGVRPYVFVCAPTGKAAVRCTESLKKQGLALRAQTIHRLLGISPTGGFLHHAGNQLPAGFLIIDESSMVDVELLSSLLSACSAGMHVLFVGDVHQLAPVGHGAPLRDLIAAGLPCGSLSEIRRNAGTIVEVCAELKAGRSFRAEQRFDLAAGKNLVHLEFGHPEEQVAELKKQLSALVNAGAVEGAEIDVLRDVQIMTTVNKKSPIGRQALNEELQQLLNPHGETAEGGKFRRGDKVINLKNNWYQVEGGGDDDQEWIANGEIGICTLPLAHKIAVTFPNPDRTVWIPLRKTENGDGGENGHVELGYAITVWKAQGSEWPIIFCLADSSAGANWIASRELWYTAISRASRLCVTIGRKHTINNQCRKVSLPERRTMLVAQVEGNLAASVEAVEGF